MNVHKLSFAFAVMVGLTTGNALAQQSVSTEELIQLNTQTAGSAISIHDPSVVLRNGQYTIWGSHLGVAKSSDLVNWTPLAASDQTFRKLSAQGATTSTPCNYKTAFNTQQVTKVKNYAGIEVDFPNFDAEAYGARYSTDKETYIDGNMWAPDIIYNETMGKWCMYLSLNGSYWSSIIILLTSNTSTGPFTYQGPIVMGGFTGQSYDGIAAPTIDETDYTIATGETSFPARYTQTDNGKFWPNCIDPCVFFDEDGELWMSYGSWSGGIFLLKLNKETGLRDYTYTYASDFSTKGASGTSDPYFGKKIAGGYYVSGEGSYIQHIDKYYYLFMSYGGYAPDGGYEMRIFRSENPDGPYVDASGNTATYTGYQMNYGTKAATNRGMKLMGAYNQWGELEDVGECAQGHNSACVDEEGRAFVVYHTKFNNGTAGHQVRVHQLFVNENGWLVVAPFCYRGEEQTVESVATGCPWTKEEIVGDYHLLMHKYKMDYANFEETTPINITLNADGTVTGDKTGTWQIKEGTSYFTLKLGYIYYYGVLCEQSINGAMTTGYQTIGHKAIAFTTTSKTGIPVWGYKLDGKSAIAYNYGLNKIDALKDGQRIESNLKLMFDPVENTTLSWTSSMPDVISETGKYNPNNISNITDVTLQAKMESCGYSWEPEYTVKALPNSITWDYRDGLVAYYDFNTGSVKNSYDETQEVSYKRFSRTQLPSLESDYERNGEYVHLYFGAQKSNSYAMMPNPMYQEDSLTGMTISMWVKRNDENNWDALWSFFNETTADAAGPRLFMNGNTYIGYNDNAGTWFDLNNSNDGVYNYIPVGNWALLTVAISNTKGAGDNAAARIYVNGTLKSIKTMSSSSGTISNIRNLNLSPVIAEIPQLQYFYLGMGSFWGSPDVMIDDLLIYDRALTSSEIMNLNKLNNRVTDFTKQKVAGDVNGDGVVDIADVNAVLTVMFGETEYVKEADVNNDGVVDIADVNAVLTIMFAE